MLLGHCCWCGRGLTGVKCVRVSVCQSNYADRSWTWWSWLTSPTTGRLSSRSFNAVSTRCWRGWWSAPTRRMSPWRRTAVTPPSTTTSSSTSAHRRWSVKSSQFGRTTPAQLHPWSVSLTTRWKVLWELSLIHIWRCRRSYACRSRWSPYH